MDRLFDIGVIRIGPPQMDAQRIGTVAEIRATAELLSRGHSVAIPVIDEGVDLVVDYSIKVQVKASGQRTPHGAVMVSLAQRARNASGTRAKPLNDLVDVLLVMATDTGSWWVIPRSALEMAGAIGRRNLVLSEHVQRNGQHTSVLSGWLDAWSVFEDWAP
jgi:hypothetical protein